MSKPVTRTTIKYAAKQAWQLMMMRGIYSCTVVGLHCVVRPATRSVGVTDPSTGNFHAIGVPKAWSSL